jgi:hypothetical protein
VELEVFGVKRTRGLEPPLGLFVHFASELGPPRTGVDLVCEWLLTLARPGPLEERARAARNLAAAGCVPASEWMEARVRAHGDPAAREGLLWAAARGRVASVLTSSAVLEDLLTEVEPGGERSARLLFPMASVGCFDESGASFAEHSRASLMSGSPRTRWARLFLLERNGCADPDLEPVLRALLADSATPPPLALQALFTLALFPGARAPAVHDLPALIRATRMSDEEDRLGRVLRLFAIAPPFLDPASTPADWQARERGALLAAWLWTDEVDPVAAHCAAWVAASGAPSDRRGTELAERLEPFVTRGRADRVNAFLKKGATLFASPALERVRLLLGLVVAGEVEALARKLGLDATASDLAGLGALAGIPGEGAVQNAARAALVDALTQAVRENRSPADSRSLLQAVERALSGLLRSPESRDGGFTLSVQQILRRGEKAALVRALERQAWPRVRGIETRDLGQTLAAFEVPSSL